MRTGQKLARDYPAATFNRYDRDTHVGPPQPLDLCRRHHLSSFKHGTESSITSTNGSYHCDIQKEPLMTSRTSLTMLVQPCAKVDPSLNSVCKAELSDRNTRSEVIEVMADTSKWVSGYKQSRPYSTIDYRPPFETHSESINHSVVGTAAS